MQVIYKQSDREQRRTRVAAYCRVSTNREEQDESYETQVSYYTSFIKSHTDWDFAGIYADKGISGTSAEERPEFQRLIFDALSGKVDLILVKSISRFSRNIVDCQRFVEILHSNGVEIRFEKENVSTADPSSFMIFGLMSTVAQSESESISQNMQWSIKKRQKSGEYKLGKIYGYDLDGRINSHEAEVIRMIFRLFLGGSSYSEISSKVGEYQREQGLDGLQLPKSEISYILHNEAYVGDKLLQKQPPKNFLTKKPDKTVPYESTFIHGGHAGIIDRGTWEAVEKKLKERKAVQFNPGRSHFLYGKVYCGRCGAAYMRRTVGKHKTWVCKERFKGHGCKNRNVREEDLLVEIAKQMRWDEVTEELSERIDRVTVFSDGIVVTRNTSV